jgi:catecholate siderophore receptor
LSKKERRRLRRAAAQPAVPSFSVLDAPARRALPPPRWLLMGALAAGATVAPAAGAVAGIGAHARERPAMVASVTLADTSWSPAPESTGAAVAAPTRRFDVAAGPLAAGLAAYAAQAGVSVELATPALGELLSPGVTGSYTATDALALLLEGTGASFERLAPGRFRVVVSTLREEVEVVDTGRVLSPRHTEPLVDTPQSITVVGSELIQAQAAISLRDVLRNVTGISIQAGEGGGGLPGDNLAIRGFAARNDVFVDGVRDFGSYSRDPYNVEQVEVSKGPSSVFAGRGSTGGALNLATKVPSLDAANSVTAALGSADFQRATLDLNHPLPEALGGAAFRVNAMYTQGDTPGRDEVRSERFGLAPSFAAGLGGRTRLWVSGSLLEEDNLPEYGIPWVPAANVPLADHADGPAPVDFDNFYGLVDRDYEKTSTLLGTARVEQDLGGGATLRAQLRGGRSDRDSVITAPRFASNTTTDLNRQLQARDLEDEILDGQVDLVLQRTLGDVGHSVVAGVEVSRETAENRPRSGPAAPLADLFDPDPHAPYAGPIVHTGARTVSTADTVAAYAFDTLRFGERWEVMAGARYDRLEVDFDNRAATGAATSFARRDDMLSWRSGVVYKPQPRASLYAAYGTSFNPAAEGNTGLSLTDVTVLLEPERSRSAEVGSKWELLGRRVLATAAVFQTEKTNARTPGIDPGDPPTVLEGRQRVRGFEVGLNGLLAPGWQAFAGYTFLDSEVVESNTPAEVGKELANTPEHSFSVWTSYRFSWGVEIGGGAQYVGDRWNSPTNVRRAPGYWKVDAMAAYTFDQRLSLRLNVANLADERYIDRVGGGHFIPGAGRSASLTAGYRF